MTGVDDLYARLCDRHETAVTRVLTGIGDVVAITAITGGLATRRPRVVVGGLVAGAVITLGAHLFQPGTLGPEMRDLTRHPIASARAELVRLGEDLGALRRWIADRGRRH